MQGRGESWRLLLAFLFRGRRGPPQERSLPWAEGPAAATCPGSSCGSSAEGAVAVLGCPGSPVELPGSSSVLGPGAGLVEQPGPEVGGS